MIITNLHDFLQAAKDAGHNLNSLVALTRTYKVEMNPEVAIKEIPSIGFNALDNEFPGLENVDLISSEDIAKYAESRNNQGKEIDSQLFKGKEL